MQLKEPIKLPAAFTQQMQELLGPETPDFLAALETPPPVSIRYNPAKRISEPAGDEVVPWCSEGYYLPERKVFTLDPTFHAGGYYVQEASSMLIAQAVSQLLPADAPLRALDLCAAPGGKSTLLAAHLPEHSLLFCNEVIRSRYQILRENLIKWGSPMTHATQQDSNHFQGLQAFFDFILVDAPCSGEGLFRKDPAAINEWSPEMVRHCAARQKRILADAVSTLRPGGIFCYSTCTYNNLENTENAAWLAETFGLEELRLELESEWGIVSRSIGYQCFPHRVRGEGLYLACFRKPIGGVNLEKKRKQKADKWFTVLPKDKQTIVREWLRGNSGIEYFENECGQIFALPSTQVSDLLFVNSQLRRTDIGLWVGTLKRNDFVPSPDLALSTLVDERIPRIDLDLEQSLRFLKREPFELDRPLEGWVLAAYEGLPMGWMKGLKKRINNYYPKEWRIRMELPRDLGDQT